MGLFSIHLGLNSVPRGQTAASVSNLCLSLSYFGNDAQPDSAGNWWG